MSKTNKIPSTSVQNVEEPKEKDTTETVSVVTDTKPEEKPNDSVAKNQRTEEKKDEAVNTNTTKVKTSPLSVNTPNDITPPINADKVPIKVGDMVMLKSTVKSTVTGTIIPVFAFKNLYKVEKILTDRIIITAGTLKFPVKSTDVDNIKK